MIGASGAAFVTTIDPEGWDPLAATPRDPDTQARAARAVGVRLDPVAPPFDDEMRQLVFERVVEAIDGLVPPLVMGVAGPAEFGLIVGYDEDGPTFFARTFFDKGKDLTRFGAEAFRSEREGMPIFLDRGPQTDRPSAVRVSVDAALAAGETSDRAMESWAAALRDDARWSDVRHAGASAFADHAMRTVLADKRRAAARYLRSIRGLFPNLPGGDLLRAAESCGYAADAAQKGGVGRFDAAVATRFLDAGQRRALARLVETALAADRDARAALASARSAMR